MQEQLNKIQADLDELKRQYNDHTHSGLDSPVLPQLPSGLANAPYATIPQPTGGATIDGAARGAINSIIATLQSLTLIQ